MGKEALTSDTTQYEFSREELIEMASFFSKRCNEIPIPLSRFSDFIWHTVYQKVSVGEAEKIFSAM